MVDFQGQGEVRKLWCLRPARETWQWGPLGDLLQQALWCHSLSSFCYFWKSDFSSLVSGSQPSLFWKHSLLFLGQTEQSVRKPCVTEPPAGASFGKQVHPRNPFHLFPTNDQKPLLGRKCYRANFISSKRCYGLPRWHSGKEFSLSVGDMGFTPGSGRCPGEGNGYPLQYYCLENSMDRGAWWTTVHGVAESDTIEQLTLSHFQKALKS